MKFRESNLTLQAQAFKCSFVAQVEVKLRDQLIANVNHSNIQKKLLLKHDLTFAEAPVICEQSDDVSDFTAEHSIVHFQRAQSRLTGNPHGRIQMSADKDKPEQETMSVNRGFSCREFHMGSTYRLRNAVCHSCGKAGQIRKVFCMPSAM